AWVFLAVVMVAASASLIAIQRVNPAVIDERFKPPLQKGQPLGDKLLVLPFLAAFLGLILFIPLDVFRFRLFEPPGAAISLLGLVLFVAGWWIMAAALAENAFAAPVVRHQTERRQTVVDTGVYGIVRHPMYAGSLLLMTGMPLWLASYAALLFALVPITLVAIRIAIEERYLKRELAGYEAYTRTVRYRLIPFVW
ncbi:MAG: methyltransferase family protein, partial [Candidatus Binatia bacterium]